MEHPEVAPALHACRICFRLRHQRAPWRQGSPCHWLLRRIMPCSFLLAKRRLTLNGVAALVSAGRELQGRPSQGLLPRMCSPAIPADAGSLSTTGTNPLRKRLLLHHRGQVFLMRCPLELAAIVPRLSRGCPRARRRLMRYASDLRRHLLKRFYAGSYRCATADPDSSY